MNWYYFVCLSVLNLAGFSRQRQAILCLSVCHRFSTQKIFYPISFHRNIFSSYQCLFFICGQGAPKKERSLLFLILRSMVWMDKYMVLWLSEEEERFLLWWLSFVWWLLMAILLPLLLFFTKIRKGFSRYDCYSAHCWLFFWMIHLEWFLKLVCFASVSCLLWICGSIVFVESCAWKLLLAPEIKSLHYLPPICKADNT